MHNMLVDSVYFGVFLTLGTYYIGALLNKRFKISIVNPMLISIILIIVILLALDIDYETYHEGSKYISYLLTPATVCLAVPLYEEFQLLKKNWFAVLAGILSGVLTSLVCIFVMCLLFGMGHVEYVTLLPKSITNAIGIGVSEALGGYVSITVAVIVVTGVFGNIFAEQILKLFRVTNPIAKGLGMGTASHAMGTAKAMEIGEVEGAMSSLSIVVAGVFTVIGANFFAGLI